MACTSCGKTHERNNCPVVNFRMDGTILVPYLNGIAGEGVDLQKAIVAGEANTSLKLDLDNNRLVFVSEKAVGGDSPDTISISTIANLINIEDLGNVNFEFSTDGDLLSFDVESGKWVSYTVPTGTPVSAVGIDADGKLVKGSLSDTESGASIEVPIGASLEWTGPVEKIPLNFLLMNGQEISRTVYSEYFALVGTTYGAGNGTTTFNIPNKNGRTGRGYDPNNSKFNAIGKTGGEETHQMSVSEMPSHNHSVNDPGHSHTTRDRWFMDAGGSGNLNMQGGGNGFARGLQTVGVNASSTGISINNRGSSTPFNVLGTYITFPYIVRVI